MAANVMCFLLGAVAPLAMVGWLIAATSRPSHAVRLRQGDANQRLLGLDRAAAPVELK